MSKRRLRTVLKEEFHGFDNKFVSFKNSVTSLAHQPFEKLGEVPYETSVKKCVTVDVSLIIFWP